MKPDELTNQEYWKVLQRIKRNAFFKPSPGPVVFGPASDIEKGVLLDLQDEGVIRLLNLSRSSITFLSEYHDISEDIKLEIIQPTFNEVYEEVKNEVEANVSSQVDGGKDDQEPSAVRRDKRELRKEMNLIIKNKKFGVQEKKFIQFLAEKFKPEQIKDIGSEIGSKDCKHLKLRVQKKLAGTNFRIITIKAKRLYDNGSYQLEYYLH